MAEQGISENSRRIARNTVLLYFRMFVLLLVGLFTSRIVLRSLGQTDFGIYGAVAGVVTMFTILTGSMSGAISRFITFELGKDNNRLPLVFSTAVSIQILLSAVIIILAETLGLWWLNNRMVIPPDRLVAARWVLQFSILSLVIQLISVPYNASIIAHERMDAFAWISIFEGFGKLAVAYCLMVSGGDRLVLYAALLAGISFITRLLYGVFCRLHFAESKYSWQWDRKLFKEMFAFAGWDFIGSGANVFREQGGNQLLNIFFGPVINGAWLLAAQVNSTVQKFVTSFTTAINPQITKSYAAGDRDYLMKLVFKGSRVSVYLLLLVICPVIFNAGFLVNLWLGADSVPPDTVLFIRLVLSYLLIESISYTMITAMLATGDIRNYQLLVGGLLLLNVPVSWICLKLGAPAQCIYWVAIVIAFLCLGARLYMLHGMIGLPVKQFLREVLLNEIAVVGVAAMASWGLSLVLPIEIWWGFLIHATASVLIVAVTVFLIGFKKHERRSWTDRLLKR
ncbi:MAG: oligosaccharide flippase family protein [Bacteroidales bacterium]|nr:oligosaccharide flippase family protein [Bacteroidales bacterium]